VPVLVLGAGYLGAALAARLCSAGQSVVGLENGFTTEWPALEALEKECGDRLALRRGDIRDSAALDDALAAAAPVETIFLLAAQASAHAGAAPAEYTEETNLRGPRLVLDAALRHNAPRVVYGSSFRVYGGPLAGTVDEDRPYGSFRDLSHLSKIYAEKLGELYTLQHNLAFSPVRLGIVYGVGPVMKRDPQFVTVPHAFALNALRREPLVVNPGGSLGFIHLDDAVDALIAAPAVGYAPANAVGEMLSVRDVASAVVEAATERGIECAVSAPGPVAPTERIVVTSRLERTGWLPSRTLWSTAGALLDYYAA